MDLGLEKKRIRIQEHLNDYLNLIFEKLDKKEDRDSFGLTCHQFLDIQNSNRKIIELRALPCLNAIYDKRFVDLLVQLNSLSLTQLIDSASTYGFDLHCLNPSFTSIGFSRYPLMLSVISFYKSRVDDPGIKILSESCLFLKQIDLSWCYKISDLAIRFLNQNCHQLRALRLNGCHQITGVNFKGCSPNLACLEAKFCSFKSEYILGIMWGGGLEYLNLSSPIKYPWGDKLGVIGLAPYLKILDFENCSLVGDDDILKISEGCPLLQEWNLSYCNRIKIDGWKSIGLNCQNLERLHANGCANLCDVGLLALVNGCKRLSVINMTNCHRITASGTLSYKKKIQDFVIEKKARHVVTPWDFTGEVKSEKI